ncbi:MAG: TonB family protein [Cellvibrionaceae bacterium]
MSSWASAEPLLNGLAISTELSKERFIAALYSDSLSSNAETILNGSGERAMELKVTDRRLSARSLNSMWIEGIAINNRGPALEAQAQNLASLTNMIRKRLVAGDTLRFDASPGNGTTVTLNGVQLGTIASDEFFPILLRTWIGRVPLSSDFKTGLLGAGNVDSDLESRYRSISPDPARIELVSTWTNAAPPAPVVTDQTIAPPPPSVSVRPPRPTLSPSELAKPTIAAIRDQDPPKAVIATKPSETKPKPAAEVIKPQEPKPVEIAAVKPSPDPVVAAPKPTPPPLSQEEDEEEEEEEQVTFSASSLLERQYYVSDSMIAIQKSVSYPRRSIERNQQGSVRLAVTVDREGTVQDVQTVEESRHELLNRAAIRAVEKAGPLSKLPDSLGGDSFTFTVPITFTVQ